MSIKMIGIDHTTASIEIRSLFALTKKNQVELMESLVKLDGIQGCVILSTCNRMELWVSTSKEDHPSLYKYLCKEKNIDPKLYHRYFIHREEGEAVSHLFSLVCGLKSMVLGEDQIITQVKDALSLAREYYKTDSVLEVLFRMAITTGKKAKSEILLQSVNRSVIHSSIGKLQDMGYRLEGKNCLVIGNGQMGKLAANLLKERGAKVTVTVRQYRSGIVEIPRGCQRIDYSKRLEILPQCDFVVSATASPNTTLSKEQVEGVTGNQSMVFLDLAVPRDIEKRVEEIAGITLYDVDDFREDVVDEETKESIRRTEILLKQGIEEFYQWYDGRDLVEEIHKIRTHAVEDLHNRLQKKLQKLSVTESQREALEEEIDKSADKMMNKFLFELKGMVRPEVFQELVCGMERIYEKEHGNI